MDKTEKRRHFLFATCLFPENLYNITVMDIFLLENDYKYAAEQMMLMLFPDERPAYPASAADARSGRSVALRLCPGETYTTAVCRLEYDGAGARGYARIRTDRLRDAHERPRLEQRIIKLAFYRAAIALGVPKPEWGCLTGVRPAKLLAGLIRRDGLSETDAVRMLTDTFDVSKERAALALAAERAAAKAEATLAPEDVCLYIGIPYCPTRCAYCSFVSVDAPKLLKSIPDYLDALGQEMRAAAAAVKAAGRRIAAVYVGGGTPTTLTAPELDRLLADTKACFDLSACREFTVEAGRPDTVTEEKLAVLVSHGVNRVSVNPQTMSDEVLETIGRRHTAAEVREAVAMVKRFPQLAFNMDLIAGLPGDTPESFSDTVREVIALGAGNITVHTLALKKGSRFLTEGTALPDGKAVGEMLGAAREKLEAAGYAPYYLYRQKFMSGSFENVGWTKPGYENLYNICIMEELCGILAVGAGGSTKLTAPGGVVKRLMAPKYPREYMERIAQICAEKDEIVRFYKSEPKGKN